MVRTVQPSRRQWTPSSAALRQDKLAQPRKLHFVSSPIIATVYQLRGLQAVVEYVVENIALI